MSTKQDENVNCLALNIAARLECHEVLIRSASDPMAMLRVLRPILTHPGVNGGEVPALYQRIADDEIRKRAASAARFTRH